MLYSAVLPVAGEGGTGVRGARDTGAGEDGDTLKMILKLIEIVGISIPSSTGDIDKNIAVERGSECERDINSMIRHYAEACLIQLLTSYQISIKYRSLSNGTSHDSEETLLVYTILSSITHISQTAQSKDIKITKNIYKFLWKILNVCTAVFTKEAILNTLNILSGLEMPSPASSYELPQLNSKLNLDIKEKKVLNLLEYLFSQASDNWHIDAESRHTTLVLLSFCLSLAQSKGGLDPLTIANTDNKDDSLHDMIKENEENIQVKKTKVHSTGRLMIAAAISSLDIKQKKSLNLAIEFLSLQLDKSECCMLKNIF